MFMDFKDLVSRGYISRSWQLESFGNAGPFQVYLLVGSGKASLALLVLGSALGRRTKFHMPLSSCPVLSVAEFDYTVHPH